MDNSNRLQILEERLKTALNPEFLEIIDESADHAHHAGAIQSGGGHFQVFLVSKLFEGQTLLSRHRLVYTALEGLIGPMIHALVIIAKTPQEHQTG